MSGGMATVEPVVISLAEYRLCHTTYQSYRDESHDHPSHAALGQVPLEGYLYEIGIEDDGIDDDGWGEDEIEDKPEYLEDMLVEMLGFVDAEDIEE